MGKSKRTIEFIANNTNEALALKKSLLEEGLDVNHIYTGSSVPILIDEGNYTSGAGNIRLMYGLFKS
ncbi:MAG: hypothetical protein AABY32_05550 [Nanoarchaeota archaeon]